MPSLGAGFLQFINSHVLKFKSMKCKWSHSPARRPLRAGEDLGTPLPGSVAGVRGQPLSTGGPAGVTSGQSPQRRGGAAGTRGVSALTPSVHSALK